MQKGIGKLKKGGVICFDDFERKSKNVDLNDLFGFISQLAINLECKVVIILNSDVFSGKEAEVFSNVKEKTISKFFYFNPSIEELFKSISDNSKYDELNDYKENILSAIEETEELNDRIYIQVLDNCLEWLNVKKEINQQILKVLVMGTFNFVLNHISFDYMEPIKSKIYSDALTYNYKEINFSNKKIHKYFTTILTKNPGYDISNYSYAYSSMREDIFVKFLLEKDVNPLDIEKNEIKIKALWKYGYRLRYSYGFSRTQYDEISDFIKTGILLP